MATQQPVLQAHPTDAKTTSKADVHQEAFPAGSHHQEEEETVHKLATEAKPNGATAVTSFSAIAMAAVALLSLN